MKGAARVESEAKKVAKRGEARRRISDEFERSGVAWCVRNRNRAADGKQRLRAAFVDFREQKRAPET